MATFTPLSCWRRIVSARTSPPEAPPAKEYNQQFLVPGSWFHGVHGLAFNKDDQLFAGSVIGQTIYRVQVDSGEVDRGIAEYTKAIELDPKYTGAYSNRGLVYYGKKDYDRAIADYNKAIETDPKTGLVTKLSPVRMGGVLAQALPSF